jgi:hypothetical protein
VRRYSALILIASVACSDARTDTAQCLVLEELNRFGSADAALSADSVDHSILGDIRGAVRSPAGEVLVLDRFAHHIVGFDRDGTVTRVIRGGRGEGPGEFMLPMHLTATDRGMAVIDYDLRRITEFDWSGDLLRVTRSETPAPWHLILIGDTAWITYSDLGLSTSPIFIRVDLPQESIIAGPSLESEDQAYGLTVGAWRTADATLLVSTARPGVWMEFAAGATLRRGSPLYPEDAPPITEQVAPRQYRVSQSQHTASGLAVIGDSLVVQGVFSLSRPFDWNDPPRRDEGTQAVAVFDRHGRHVATLPLPPSSRTRFMSADRNTGRLFVPVAEPYPQVIEYQLLECLAHG